MTHLRVKEIAEGKGWNIQELSWKARLSYSTAHALWHDKPKQLDRSILDRVAVALNVKVSELFGGDPVTPQETESGNWFPALLAA